MPEAGYFEQKHGSPTGFALVVAVHVAALGALALAKGPQFLRPDPGPLIVTAIPIPPDPPTQPPPEPRPKQQRSTMTVAPTPTPIPTAFPRVDPTPFPPPLDTVPPGNEDVRIARIELPAPVRREAALIPRDLQPPYPTSEQRAQRSGSVRVRLTIGPDGRVKAVERLSATSDAFWRVTERQALSRWRFRPATLDGRPVESSREMTVTFRIEDV